MSIALLAKITGLVGPFSIKKTCFGPKISTTFTKLTNIQPSPGVGEIAMSSCPVSARRSTAGISTAPDIVFGPFSKSLVFPGLLILLSLLSSVCSLVPWLAPCVVHVISLGIWKTVGLGAPAALRLLP